MIDLASENAIEFLGILQEGKARLIELRRDYFCDSERCQTFFNLTSRTYTEWSDEGTKVFDGNVSLGLFVGIDGREYELCVSISWDKDGWVIDTDASVQNEDDDGSEQVGKQPTRRSQTLFDCKNQVLLSVDALRDFKELISDSAT